MDLKILNVSMCIDTVPNGYQTAIRDIASDYRELNCGHPNFNEEILRIADEQQSDLVILQIQADGIISRETCQKLAQESFVLNFNGDCRQTTPPWMLSCGEVIQMTCFSNEVDVKNCRDYGITAEFLPYAIDPLRYNKHGVILPDVPEIVFFGNHYGDTAFPLSNYRRRAVERLQHEFGSRFGVYGTGWGNAKGNLNSSQKDESIVYNNAKLAISISHFNYSRYVSDRLHRAQASGICVISHDFDDIYRDYRPGENIAIFSSIDGLVGTCHHFLNNPEERNKIADAGYQLAHSTYQFKNLAENIKNLYLKHK